MKVNDLRHQKQELSFHELEAGKVYVSSRLQRYVIMTKELSTVCLQSGELFEADEHDGDVFEPVNAVLEIR